MRGRSERRGREGPGADGGPEGPPYNSITIRPMARVADVTGRTSR
jgi:hypothetical protein